MRYGVGFVLGLALATPSLAADQLLFGARPSWVAAQTLAPAARATADIPAEILLFDSQQRLEPTAASVYLHYALRINSGEGLAAAAVAAEWNPAFEDLTVHHVTLVRGAQRIDLLSQGQKFTILRREQNLDKQTLDGRFTATLQPEGLQVGDIIDVALTSVRRDPTLRGHMEASATIDFPARVNHGQLRILSPANAPIRRRTYRGLGEPVLSRAGADNVATWTFAPSDPVPGPKNAPPRFARGKSVDMTAFSSWADLSMLLLPHFEQAAVITADSPLQSEIARIRAASSDPATRAQLALELVQGRIRYVNLALGTAGLVPAPTATTWQRRFGDCKAKTVLLIGLLRALDIAAVPVLVSSDGDGMDARLPMVGLFDHVLVKATIGGRSYWLDGTRSGDGRLDRVEVPAFRWGLPIIPSAALERIMPAPLTAPAMETLIHTDAAAGVDKPVPTTVEIVYRGDAAIAQNQVMTALDPALRVPAQREFLAARLDRFDIDRVTSSYDPAALTYRLRAEGRQTLDIGEDGYYWSEVPSLGFKADFRRSEGRDRDAPVAIGFPAFTRARQTIVLPRTERARINFQIAPTSVTLAGTEYRRTVTNADGVVTIDNHTRTLVPEIPLAEALAAEPALRKLEDSRVWMSLRSPRVSVDDVAAQLGKTPRTANDYLQAATKYLKEGEQPKALAALDRGIGLDPSDLYSRVLRAQLRSEQGDSPGALADAAFVLRKDPNNASIRGLRASLAWKAGNVDAALAEAAALAPVDNAAAQITRGQIFDLVGRQADAVAAFRAALSIERDPLTHTYIAGALPVSDSRGRRAALDAAIALGPTDPTALYSVAGLALKLGDHDQALSLLDRAFLKSPDDLLIRHSRAVALALAGKKQAADREFDAIAAKALTASELNELCWAKVTANVALERALRECDRSLALEDAPATRDSKGALLLRMERWDDAIREFDAALQDEEFANALFGRAIAYARKGDRARSDSDAARALRLYPPVERVYGHSGLTR